jgi:hypothetical protein
LTNDIIAVVWCAVEAKYDLHSLSNIEQQSTSEQDDDTQDRKNDHLGHTADCTAFHDKYELN